MAAVPTDIGTRIAVVGTSGCGKSYVAETLAAILAIPYVNCDAIEWQADWQPTPPDVRLLEKDIATRGPAWTIDGDVSSSAKEDQLVLDRCDSIVWLDLPRWQVWPQVAWRSLGRIRSREPLWHGNVESWSRLFSRDSIILWSVYSFNRRRCSYRAMFADPALGDRVRVHLRSRNEVGRWLAAVRETAAVAG